MDNKSFNDVNFDDNAISQINDSKKQNDFINTLIDNEKIYVKKIEILFLELEELLQGKEVVRNELIERIEVGDSSEYLNEIKSMQDNFDNEYSSKLSEIKDQLLNLDKHYKSCVESYNVKIEEIELLTKNKKLSSLLKQRIKEYKKEIGYFEVKIEFCSNFLKSITEGQKNDLTREFQQLKISLTKKEIDKRFFREKMILVVTMIISIGIALTLLGIIIKEFVKVVNAFSEPSTKSIITSFKSIRNISTIIGVLLVVESIYKKVTADDPEDFLKAKSTLNIGIGMIITSCITFLILK